VTLNNLGVLLKDQGRFAEAGPQLTRALAIFEAVLGPDHPDVLAVRANHEDLQAAAPQGSAMVE
jgi:Tfp pilus assembly protein PilF